MRGKTGGDGHLGLAGDLSDDPGQDELLEGPAPGPGGEPAALPVVAVVTHGQLWTDEEQLPVVEGDPALIGDYYTLYTIVYTIHLQL